MINIFSILNIFLILIFFNNEFNIFNIKFLILNIVKRKDLYVSKGYVCGWFSDINEFYKSIYIVKVNIQNFLQALSDLISATN